MDGKRTIDSGAFASGAIARCSVRTLCVRLDDARALLAGNCHSHHWDLAPPAPSGPDFSRPQSAPDLDGSAQNRRIAGCADASHNGLSPRLRRLITDRLSERTSECLLSLYFDQDGICLGEDLLASDAIDAIIFQPDGLIRTCQRLNARTLVLAHNHPGGLARPSWSDTLSTREMARRAYVHGIALAEHLIVGREGIYSMRRSRMLT